MRYQERDYLFDEFKHEAYKAVKKWMEGDDYAEKFSGYKSYLEGSCICSLDIREKSPSEKGKGFDFFSHNIRFEWDDDE